MNTDEALKLLGLNNRATQDQIKKKFWVLAKLYHPDVNKNAESVFKNINSAYQLLQDQISKESIPVKEQPKTTSKRYRFYVIFDDNKTQPMNLQYGVINEVPEDILLMILFNGREYRINVDKGQKIPINVEFSADGISAKIKLYST